ncbi:MAG: aldo/keto reductase [Rikenellaceae bacterium]
MDSKNNISRRDFLRYAGTFGVAMTAQGLINNPLFAAEKAKDYNGFSSVFNNKRDLKLFNARFDAKGLPVTTISDTGVIIPRMGLGCGSRFSAFALNSGLDAAHEMLNYALDKGFYYWDTAPIYMGQDRKTGRTVYSEDVLGEVVKTRRNEILLNSKMVTRDPDEFMFSLETTLKKLNTDYLDMMMVHGVTSMENLQGVKDAKIVERMLDLKDQGVFRIFGFSGHSDAAPLKALIDMNCFQNCLIAMDPYRPSNEGGLREDVVQYANDNNVGVMFIKAIRSYENKPQLNISAEDGIRRALEFKGSTGVMVGMDSIDIVDKNVKILQDYASLV